MGVQLPRMPPPYRVMVPILGEEGLLIGHVILYPAVGYQEADNGWVVDSGGPIPVHHQGCLVQGVHLHVPRSATAH